jgi:hypothetical protein
VIYVLARSSNFEVSFTETATWHDLGICSESGPGDFEREPSIGLSIRDYCLAHDPDEKAFYRCQRLLTERDRHPSLSPDPAFVPTTLVEAPTAISDTPINIHLKGGGRVRVRAGCDRELLAAVLAHLKEGGPC